ncbi:hypothetical protein FISHEDRAFT_51447 [Fistulina hepatica ATCC 64428]|uniref:Uncharacterized protein n=1 Tax=Fistulina hepatica ATCC 64428 TaxID=1128425 RepID=A0A0D7A172_9AGAR|nr:hypothetical protein FISHEDRAFT_51447 [Fistulina hepatica ATCC 64428]
MSPEHKNFAAQTELLNNLRRDISEMDAKILHDEASVGDFKRTSAKAFLSIKFGGLLELSEKGVIVAEYGNLITAEIPEETTPPGGQRSWYRGQPTVEQMVSEATRALSDVTFNAGPFRPAHATHNPAAQQSEVSTT